METSTPKTAIVILIILLIVSAVVVVKQKSDIKSLKERFNICADMQGEMAEHINKVEGTNIEKIDKIGGE